MSSHAYKRKISSSFGSRLLLRRLFHYEAWSTYLKMNFVSRHEMCRLVSLRT